MNFVKKPAELIQVLQVKDSFFLSDLMKVRSSYHLSARAKAAYEARYARELRDVENRAVFMSFLPSGPATAYVQLVWSHSKDPDLANGKDRAHIHDLRVRKDLQGKGYGRRLVEFLEEEARRRNFQVLTLGVESSNGRAIKLYEKMGYQKFKQVPYGASGEIIYFMEKPILRRN